MGEFAMSKLGNSPRIHGVKGCPIKTPRKNSKGTTLVGSFTKQFVV
jgi:hypothetical protein